jgi:hypothetical protein
VVERPRSEVADIYERDHGDVLVADGHVEYECSALALQEPSIVHGQTSRRECVSSVSRVQHNLQLATYSIRVGT